MSLLSEGTEAEKLTDRVRIGLLGVGDAGDGGEAHAGGSAVDFEDRFHHADLCDRRHIGGEQCLLVHPLNDSRSDGSNSCSW
jgi:hypothetical protein